MLCDASRVSPMPPEVRIRTWMVTCVWFSRTQRYATLSIQEVEYVSMSYYLEDVLFLSELLGFMRRCSVQQKAVLSEDHKGGAVFLSNKPLSSLHAKYVDVRYHFIRNEVKQGPIGAIYMRTECQGTDIRAKSIPLDLLEKCRRDVRGS